MWRVDSLEKTLILGGIGGKRRRGWQRWDGWMASLTRWTWVWVNSGNWWWTGRPGVLQFMGSQRVGHDWATGLIWSEWFILTCWIRWQRLRKKKFGAGIICKCVYGRKLFLVTIFQAFIIFLQSNSWKRERHILLRNKGTVIKVSLITVNRNTYKDNSALEQGGFCPWRAHNL